jgi:hypothetical protein
MLVRVLVRKVLRLLVLPHRPLASAATIAAAAGLCVKLRRRLLPLQCCRSRRRLLLQAPHTDFRVLASSQAHAAHRSRPQHRPHNVTVSAAGRQHSLRLPKQPLRRLLLLLL